MGYLTCKYNAHTRPGQLHEKSYLTAAHNSGRIITYESRSTSVRDSNTYESRSTSVRDSNTYERSTSVRDSNTYESRSTSVRDSNTPILDLLLSLTVIDLLT